MHIFQVETTNFIFLGQRKNGNLNSLLSAEAADGLFEGIPQQVGNFLASQELIIVFCSEGR